MNEEGTDQNNQKCHSHHKADKDLSAEDKKDYEARMEEQIKELPSFISKKEELGFCLME